MQYSERTKGKLRMIGAVETGGTKMVLAVADEGNLTNLVDRISIPTETPEQTIPQMVSYFKKWDISALGIACFGPLDLNPASDTYGFITKTPKEAWADCNITGMLKEELGVPVSIDTDVNGAVLGEITFGAAKGCDSAIYITVGTGIGTGVYVNGTLLHGLVHPEAGHILLSRQDVDLMNGYKSCCPFHDNCLEGLASGPAIEKRWGKSARELVDEEAVWELEAKYLAQGIANYILVYSPQRVVLGGGVMHHKKLYPMIRKNVQEVLNGYVQNDLILRHIDEYIVEPRLGENSGIIGALMLGKLN